MSTLNKSEKRRGRPPKNISVPKVKKINKKDDSEQLVLYLPSFNNEQNDKINLIKKNTELHTENDFTPFDSDNESSEVGLFSHLTDKNNSESKSNYDAGYDDGDSTTNSFDIKKINIDKLLEEIQRRDSIINVLRMKLKDKSIFNENTLTLTRENRKQLVNLGLISINKGNINICEKSDFACWWCTYCFDTQPLFMPDHYKNNMYYVFGNFCSFACMLGYNEDMDDYRKGVRSALIKQLYRDIFNSEEMNIKAAGPRELLDKFGGPLSITKYRDANIVSRKTFKITIPPQIPLISDLEELIIEKK